MQEYNRTFHSDWNKLTQCCQITKKVEYDANDVVVGKNKQVNIQS